MTEYVYAWGNNPVRAKLKGRRCRLICTGALGSALVEFEDGHRVVTSRRALRPASELQQLSLLTQEGAHPAPGLPASNRTEKDQSAA